MDTSPLHDAGLTDGEIKVYLALLEVGSSTSGPIVERSGVAKSIVYLLLERLMQKGLVSCIVKEKTKRFQAAQPTKLLEYIDERGERLQENRREVERILPQLMLAQAMARKSEARMYFGFRGIRTAHEHCYEKLKRGEEYVFLGIPAEQPHEQHLYWQRDHVRRAAAGIRCRLLFNAGTDPATIANRNSYRGCEAKLMSSDIVTPAQLEMFADTTLVILQSPEAVCVEIVNPHIADSFKAYFDEYWKRGREKKRKIEEKGKPTRRRA